MSPLKQKEKKIEPIDMRLMLPFPDNNVMDGINLANKINEIIEYLNHHA